MKRVHKLLAVLCLLTALCACGSADGGTAGETALFTDDCGRRVTVPAQITRVAPSGAVAQMILATLCPELLVGLASTPGSSQMAYLPARFLELPTFGQLYGSKSTLNLESLLDADAQIIIDLGDKKAGHAADMNKVQRQSGIPTVFLETTLDSFAGAYRRLGTLLGCEEKAESLAAYVEETVRTARENALLIPEEARLSVMYGSGSTGLNCNARGSVQADVIELVGAVNAIVVPEKELQNKGGGNTINMEQLYLFDPDVVLLTEGGPYDGLAADETWGQLRAVENGDYYEIPCLPYNWLSNPPSINRVLGVWWLGNLLYPEVYDYDMAEKTMEFYSLFYGCDLTRQEAEALLSNSTGKRLP